MVPNGKFLKGRSEICNYPVEIEGKVPGSEILSETNSTTKVDIALFIHAQTVLVSYIRISQIMVLINKQP